MATFDVSSDTGVTATVVTASPSTYSVSSPPSSTYNISGGQFGPAGPTGATGATGATGQGVPTGGSTSQILKKTSGTDYATAWEDLSDATLATSDITTNNVSTSKHGFAPKAPNDATKYLDGTGAYSVPPGSGGGTGTVTSVSVVSANGLAGSVATATTTPAITLSTSVTGILKGNGTAVSAASAGTDYLTPSGNGSALTGITESQITNLTTDLAGKLSLTGGTMTGPIIGFEDKGGEVFNVKAYGAKGDGTTDDTTAIQSAITAALGTINATSTVFFPAGTYKVTSALNCTSATVSAAGNGVILRGVGHNASRIYKGGSGFVAVTFNGNGGPGGNSTSYGGMVDMTIEGAGTTGGLLQTNSANQMFFRGCSFNGSNDFAWDFNTMQDSYFSQCTFNTNHSASAPIIHIYGSANGNTNMMWFNQIRVEDFYGTAIKIEAGSGNSGNNNGFYFDQIKLESAVVSGDFFVADGATLDLHLSRVFGSANAYKGGYSTPINFINSAAYQSVSFHDVYFNDGIGSQNCAINIALANTVYGTFRADTIYYNGNAAKGTINFANNPTNGNWSLSNIGTDGSGPATAGTLPFELSTISNDDNAGGASFTGNLKTAAFQLTTTPTNGYIMTSDGSGNGTWQAAPSNVHITVSTTAPSSPSVNDLWIDIT